MDTNPSAPLHQEGIENMCNVIIGAPIPLAPFTKGEDILTSLASNLPLFEKGVGGIKDISYLSSVKKLILLFSLIILSCSNQSDVLMIATSANMQFTMKELIAAFEAETSVKSEIVVGSSGKLTAQILQGAPYDMFFSANAKYPSTIYEKGMALQHPQTYALGQLILWSSNEQVVKNWTEFKTAERIAIANPEIAPYGIAAMEVINSIAQIDLTDKLVFGESISQVNQFIFANSVDYAFTSTSSRQAMNTIDGYWVDIPDSLYGDIIQSTVILKSSHQQENAKQFLEFIKSELGKSILIKYGYKPTK